MKLLLLTMAAALAAMGQGTTIPASSGVTGGGLSGLTANNYLYATGATTAASTASLVQGFSGADLVGAGARSTSGAAIVGPSGVGVFCGNFSIFTECAFDWSVSTGGSLPRLALISKTGDLASITHTGSVWIMAGIDISNSMPITVPKSTGTRVHLTSQTASISTTTGPNSGQINPGKGALVPYSLVGRSGTGTVMLTITWVDEAGNTQTFSTSNLAGVAQTSGMLFCVGGNGLSYSTTVVGTRTYDVSLNTMEIN